VPINSQLKQDSDGSTKHKIAEAPHNAFERVRVKQQSMLLNSDSSSEIHLDRSNSLIGSTIQQFRVHKNTN
jgi:hypothetical protein